MRGTCFAKRFFFPILCTEEVVPRQQFELSIQAAIGAKVIARDNVKAFRKDVTAGLYGGEPSSPSHKTLHPERYLSINHFPG